MLKLYKFWVFWLVLKPYKLTNITFKEAWNLSMGVKVDIYKHWSEEVEKEDPNFEVIIKYNENY
jgi:hypothetical protein